MNGTPALPGELSATSCHLALVKLRNHSAVGTFLDLLLVFHYSSPRALPGELEHSWSLMSTLSSPWNCCCFWHGSYNGSAAMDEMVEVVLNFLVLIKAWLWGLLSFNISSYQCFVVWYYCWWLSISVGSVRSFRECRPPCRQGRLFQRDYPFLV